MNLHRVVTGRARVARLAIFTALLLALCAAGGALAPRATAGIAPGQMWMTNVFDGGANVDDRYVDVARAADGSLYALGVINYQYGVFPGVLMLVKCDAAGAVTWRRAVAVPTATQVFPMAVTVDPAGNVIAVASWREGGDTDWFTAKMDPAGTLQWWAVKASADPTFDDDVSDVVADKAGNVYVCGSLDDDSSAVVKYDVNDDPANPGKGLEKWTHYTTGNHAAAWAEANSIAIDGYANLYVTGSRLMKTGEYNVFVEKLRGSDGTSRWLRGWDGAAHKYDEGDVVRYRNGYVYVGGYSETKSHGSDIVVLRYAARSGTRHWARTWDNPAAHKGEEISDLRIDGYGNAYVTGTTFYMTAVKYKALLLKIGRNGTVRWSRTYYDRASNGYGSWWSLAVSDTGTVWTVGFVRGPTVSLWTMARYSRAGKRAWLTRWDGPAPGHLGGAGAYACVLSGTRDLFVAGDTVVTGEYDDTALAWLRR